MYPKSHNELVTFLNKKPFVECNHPVLGTNILRFVNEDKNGCWFKDEKENNRFVPTKCFAILSFQKSCFVLSMQNLEVKYNYVT